MAGAAENRPSRRKKANAADEKAGGERLFDRELEALPPELRWREWMLRVEAVIFAAAEPVTRETLGRVVGKDCNIDLLIDDLRDELNGRPYEIVAVAGGYPDDLTPALDSPENLEALKTYITLMNDYGPEGIGNFNFPEVVAALQSGQVAMTVDGTSIVSQAVDPEKSRFADEFVLALPPGGPAGRSPAIAVHGLGVPAGAEHSEAARKFIEWATSTETLTKLAINEAYPDFTRASVAQNPDVKAKYAGIQDNFLDLRVEALNLAVGNYRPLIPTWPEIGAAVGENINAVVNGLMSPEDALAAAQDEMEAILGN